MEALGHALPLKDFLLKPVQRILKYPLLFLTLESDVQRILREIAQDALQREGEIGTRARMRGRRIE